MKVENDLPYQLTCNLEIIALKRAINNNYSLIWDAGSRREIPDLTTVIVGVLYPRNVHPKVRGGTEYRQ